ncbi:aminoacyl-tRNA synthetase [Noviherbaspirillum cavernae]|uniref:Aminoacyl-tRNA synthetase n=1 Tax=Noviherbaspirillum cavernae TaxID=2320862 RepID=A0A418WX88_9BURK|nr:aminoacyl-tRNA synthetase [Noviherbaspirillum cavernae]RJG04822.1 aminoacyl-tRNA synthetase [Noviherbaspirillum cavernae]
MRMSDEEYFRSCVAKERHLAQLLGHHNIEEFYESAGTLWDDSKALPQWTRDWNACAHLMIEHDITIAYHRETGEAHSSSATVGPIVVRFADHPTKDQAIRFAIVKAVTSLLEHAHHHKHCHGH